MYFFYLVPLMVAGVAAWPEQPPNCPLAGNWSNYDQTNSMVVWDVMKGVPEERSDIKVYQVVHKRLNSTVSGRSATRDPKLLGLVLSSEDSVATHFTVLACYDNELWVMQVPLMMDSASFTRIFTLAKLPTGTKSF